MSLPFGIRWVACLQRGPGAACRLSNGLCLQVQAEPHKSPPALTSDGKRGSKARNAPALEPGEVSVTPLFWLEHDQPAVFEQCRAYLESALEN
jgi:hypothetical protein